MKTKDAFKWQVISHVILMLFALCALIPFILLIAGAVSVPYPSVICSGVSLLFLLGLVLFKWKDFVREVQKKFRV